MNGNKNPFPDLKNYDANGFHRGRSALIEALWLLAQSLLFSSFVPGSWHRRALLRLFGAKVGKGVVIKPRVTVKFPWKLEIGDHTWIGERAWIDNLAFVVIADNVVLSQDCYLCTGSHDYRSVSFDLRESPIHVESGAWIGARATVGPGVTVAEGAVLSLGSIATHTLRSWTIHAGVPAMPLRARIPRTEDN